MAKQTFTTGQVLTAAQMTSLQQTAMGGGSTTAKTASYVLVAADAGTVVQMNSASATTITGNTALFAAGDSVQIQNVGAGVCTVTAGTATVSTAGSLALSQYEGGQLYFNTTSAALFFDVVQASGSTSGLTFISATSFSAVSSVSLPVDSFNATYQNYKAIVTWTGSGPAGNPSLSLRTRVSGTDQTGADYYYALQKLNTSATRSDAGAAAATSCVFTSQLVSNALTQGGLELTILKPKAQIYPVILASALFRDNSDGFLSINGMILNLSGTAADSLSLILSGGNTFTGTIRLYGFQNS